MLDFIILNLKNILLIFFFSYLFGSLSFAILISKFRGLDDPRKYGSTNPGATNVLRSGDKKAALLTLIGDAGKGFIVVFFVRFLVSDTFIISEQALLISVSAISVFLGHLFPIFFRFKGGKGVATSLGVFLGLDFLIGFFSIIVWLFVFSISKISSLSAIVTAILAPFFSFFFLFSLWGDSSYILVFSIFFMSLLLLARHFSNISLLIKGKEK